MAILEKVWYFINRSLLEIARQEVHEVPSFIVKGCRHDLLGLNLLQELRVTAFEYLRNFAVLKDCKPHSWLVCIALHAIILDIT